LIIIRDLVQYPPASNSALWNLRRGAK